MVEHRTVNAVVAGSSPAIRAISHFMPPQFVLRRTVLPEAFIKAIRRKNHKLSHFIKCDSRQPQDMVN